MFIPAACAAAYMRPDQQVRVQAFDEGLSEDQIHEYTNIDPWFLAQLGGLHATDQWLRGQQLDAISAEDWRQVKKRGFSDPQIATALGEPSALLQSRCLVNL